MSPDTLHTSNPPRQIDHPKYTVFSNDTVVLDVIFQNYKRYQISKNDDEKMTKDIEVLKLQTNEFTEKMTILRKNLMK